MHGGEVIGACRIAHDHHNPPHGLQARRMRLCAESDHTALAAYQ